jgi:peptide/nickel transport system substrate-binding protein
MTRHWSVRSAALAATAFLAAGVLAACSGSGGGGDGGSSSSGAHSVLTVATGSAGTFADNFSPFSPSHEDPAWGMIYEPLFFFNTAKSGDVKPWLGTKYAWSNGGKTLTVQLRHGVKWTDGKPFTSSDVVFSYDMAVHSTALNIYGLPLASVSADGTYGVTINFTKPAYSYAYYALGRQLIVPKHVWQSVSNPSTDLNEHPVGTGAYELSNFSSQAMTFTANPHYYMPGLPKFKTIRFVSFNSNTSSDAAIENGTIDWAGSFIPSIKKLYLARDPKYVVSDIPLATAFLVPNVAKGPTASLAVRQAISTAIDRNYISKTVYSGYATPSNPEALILPNYKAQLDPSLAGASFPAASASKAKSILTKAGIKTPVNITVDMVSGYTDYLSVLQIMQSELKPAGINLTIAQPAFATFTADQSTGNFQMLIASYGYTPDPYSYYYQLLDSAVAPAIGKPDSVGDYNRYKNAGVDTALSQIAATNDKATQNQAFYKIENTFAQQLPDIPLFNSQNEIEFNGHVVSNIPAVSNPYAAPAVYIQPDIGWVAMHLTPAKYRRAGWVADRRPASRSEKGGPGCAFSPASSASTWWPPG